MMDEADLPPLPPPLPPTHSRSFSSSSSSSAGSPPLASTAWPGSSRAQSNAHAATNATRTFERARSTDGRDARATVPAAADSRFAPHELDARIGSDRSRLTVGLDSPEFPPFDNPPSSGATPQAQHRHGAQATAFFSKVSPSLASQSRYSNSPSNIARIGLRGSPEPLGLGIGNGTFSRHHAAAIAANPPGPAMHVGEVSDEDGLTRFDETLQRTELEPAKETRHADGTNSGNASPPKPDRPPKSERRSTSTPTREGGTSPTFSETSPSIVVLNSHRSDANPEELRGVRRSASIESFGLGRSPSSERPGLVASVSSRSLGPRSSRGDQSDTMEELREGVAMMEPRRRLKARTTSSEGDFDSNVERLRDQKTSELRQKNQRILDSINTPLERLDSPPLSNRAYSPSPSSEFDDRPRRAVQRSSTSSTIRKLAALDGGEDDELLQGTLPNFSSNHGSTDEDEPSQPRDSRATSELDEFGMTGGTGGPIRRSATLGNVSTPERRGEPEQRSLTGGFQSRSRTSLLRKALDDDDNDRGNSASNRFPLPARSATSMSSYPSTVERIRSRRSEIVGSERTRAASSLSDTREQDRTFSEGMRRLASRELLRSPPPSEDRKKRHADASESVRSPSTLAPEANGTASPSRTLRDRPALPSEFRHSPSASISSARAARMTPSSSSSRDLDRIARSRSTVSSLASPISPSTSATSLGTTLRRQARSEVSYNNDEDDDDDGEDEHETTPKSARKSTFDPRTSSSVGRARTSVGYGSDRRGNSVSEMLDRPHSRLSRDVRRSGPKSPDVASRGTATPPLSSSARPDERFSYSSDLAARRERLRGAEVGSEAWMSELDSLRNRGTRSRASGDDGRSTIGDHVAHSPSDAERDRTVRAINALLAGQGIVATAVEPISPSSTAFSQELPRRKRDSVGGHDRSRRISFANGTHEDSRLAPGSNSMSRSNSYTSRDGGDVLAQAASLDRSSPTSDHHKLLLSAFDHFDRHFSHDANATDRPESVELVRRMVALIASTTKLNSGIRSLSESIKEEQIEAQLDEARRESTVSLAQFDKSVHALLRTSDDQVRNLSEDLIAITRADRERERLRKGTENASRPISRASQSRQVEQSPASKRPATAGSVLEGATVSLSSSRSPNVPREVFRNPLEHGSDDGSASAAQRNNTLGYPLRSPFSTAAIDSPTPASRRGGSSSETRLRRSSISTSSTYSATRGSDRRTKGSGSNNRSPTQSSHVPFPTSAATAPMLPRVDSTPALSNESPTRNNNGNYQPSSYAFPPAAAARPPRRPLDGLPPRTYSGASGDAIAREALELAANVDEQRTLAERDAALDRLEDRTTTTTRNRTRTPDVDEAELGSIVSTTPTSESRRPRTRSSMGAIGTALKNAFTPNKKKSAAAAGISSSASTGYLSSSSRTRDSDDASSTAAAAGRGGGGAGGGRDDRRREVENILRRSSSRT